MLKDLIQEIIERLSQVDGLRYIAEDWGQLDYEQPPVQWPCALVDIQNVQYSQIGQGGLMGNCTFTITLADRALQRVSVKATPQQKETALKVFDIMDQIYLKLHATGSDQHSPFVMQHMERTFQPELQCFTLTFATQFKQTKPTRTVPLPPGNIDIRKA